MIGSIIYLKQGDICPADIILLDSSEIKDKLAYCMIDTSFFNGKTGLELKKACTLTQRIYIYNYFTLEKGIFKYFVLFIRFKFINLLQSSEGQFRILNLRL